MSLKPTMKIIKDDDRKLKAITKNLKAFNGRYLLVGIFGSFNRKGQSIANIMATHEFGSRNKRIKKRSWMRKFVDGNKYEVKKKIETVCSAILTNKMNSQKGLQILGVWLTNNFKRQSALLLLQHLTKLQSKERKVASC